MVDKYNLDTWLDGNLFARKYFKNIGRKKLIENDKDFVREYSLLNILNLFSKGSKDIAKVRDSFRLAMIDYINTCYVIDLYKEDLTVYHKQDFLSLKEKMSNLVKACNEHLPDGFFKNTLIELADSCIYATDEIIKRVDYMSKNEEH